MDNVQERNPLGYERVGTLLRQFALPSIIAMLVSSLYNIVDQIFIGNGVGYLGNAATTVAFPFTTICLAIALLVGVGSASKYSLELGRENYKEAQSCIGNAIILMVGLGVIYAVLAEIFIYPLLLAFGSTKAILPLATTYVRITAVGMPFLIFTNAMCNLIRADGSPRYSMICMVVGAVINTILDPIFIFTFDMGVAGAAYATVISQVVSAGMAFVYIPKFKRVKVNIRAFKFDIKSCGAQLSYGLSNGLNQVAMCVVQIVLNNSLSYYGLRSIYGSDIPISVAGIVMKVNGIFMAVFIGLCQGMQPIIGFNYGAKQYPRVKKTYRLAVIFALTIGFIGLILFQTIPKQILSIFGTGSDLYFEFGAKFMRTFLLLVPAISVQMISANMFSAIGKPVKGVVLSLSRQVLFFIPLLLILPRFFGLTGLLFAAPISDAIAFMITVLLIVNEFRKME